MVKSMTGFGRCEVTEGSRKYTVEMKSVNHRYFDVNIKMPRAFNCFEADLRKLLKEYAERGKIDVFITFEDFSEDGVSLRYNEKLAGEYLSHMRAMAEKFGLRDDVTVSTLSRYPEVFVMEQESADEGELWAGLKKAFCGAAEQFSAARGAEGERLKADLCEKLDNLGACATFIEERYPQILAEYRARLTEKVREVLADSPIDEGRIAAEVTVFADKICVDEETVRLRSHIDGMRTTLEAGGAVGRRLDFIAQEMNREANTILSKTTDAEISDVGIRLKTEIEKIREQIQNLE